MDMDDACPETETSRVIREVAEARQKIVKITIRAEHADGSSSEITAVEPEDVEVNTIRPDRAYVYDDASRLVKPTQPPRIVVRFTASEKHPVVQRVILPAEE